MSSREERCKKTRLCKWRFSPSLLLLGIDYEYFFFFSRRPNCHPSLLWHGLRRLVKSNIFLYFFFFFSFIAPTQKNANTVFTRLKVPGVYFELGIVEPAFIWHLKLLRDLNSTWRNGFSSLIFTDINRSVISAAYCSSNKYFRGLFKTPPWSPGFFSLPGVCLNFSLKGTLSWLITENLYFLIFTLYCQSATK